MAETSSILKKNKSAKSALAATTIDETQQQHIDNDDTTAADGTTIEEKSAVGQIIQGEDGEYYLLYNADSADDAEMEDFQNLQLVVGEDGSETLVLDNGQVAAAVVQQHHTDGADDEAEAGGRYYEDGHEQHPDDHMMDEEDDEQQQLAVGAMATAETGEEFAPITVLEPIPQGMKLRRNRVYGTCRCPECGQSFVNTARLERHLAVHQVFGSYLCPLCGKTYKYEYNLFYHWRRTCRDLNELMPIEERKVMDVNALRQLVDEVAQKKAEVGDIAPHHVPQQQQQQQFSIGGDIPPTSFGSGGGAGVDNNATPARRGNACAYCGVVVLAAHLDRHMAIHRGEAPVDQRGVCGGYYCDLCGLMFRQHFNLIKHWRSSCPEIQSQLPDDIELTMDDDGLKRMVRDLLAKRCSDEAFITADRTAPIRLPEKADVSSVDKERDTGKKSADEDVNSNMRMTRKRTAAAMHSAENALDEPVDVTTVDQQGKANKKVRQITSSATADDRAVDDDDDRPQLEPQPALTADELAERQRVESELAPTSDDDGQIDEQWAEEEGIVFADDYMDDDDDEQQFVIREDGTLGPLGLPSAHSRAKWSMMGGPVQCPECFRSFANAGRLERHLAGFHSSYGTHHCILCGNRFKYDYNLLFHYRRSCPYTKAFIDRDVREHMDAPSLRKLVRNLAQKEVRLTPQIHPPPRLAIRQQHQSASGSSPPKARLAMRYPSNQPPAHLLMPRPGLPEGKTCPVCGIIFYGNGAVDRHMKAAHPQEWDEWEAAGGLPNDAYGTDDSIANVDDDHLQHEDEHQHAAAVVATAKQETVGHKDAADATTVDTEIIEPPPMLTMEEPGEEPPPPIAEREDDDDGGEVQLDMDAVDDVQGLIDSGQLQVQDGDEIIVIREGDETFSHETIGEEHIVETYESPLRRGAPRSSRFVMRNTTLTSADDQGLEVAAILTEMKEDSKESAKRFSRRQQSMHQEQQQQRFSTTDHVMTAQFEEELDVDGHTETIATVQQQQQHDRYQAPTPRKRGRPARTRNDDNQSAPSPSPKKQIITPKTEKIVVDSPTIRTAPVDDESSSANLRRSSRRSGTGDTAPWKTRSRYGD